MNGIENLAHQVVLGLDGEEGLERHVYRRTKHDEEAHTVARNPMHGVAVLTRLEHDLHKLLERWLADARGNGVPWTVLAAALDVPYRDN